jgi:hypothetical protein
MEREDAETRLAVKQRDSSEISMNGGLTPGLDEGARR